MPNLLGYYTRMLISIGVLRHPKVTWLGRPATEPGAPEEPTPSIKGRAQGDDNHYACRVLSIRSPMAFAK